MVKDILGESTNIDFSTLFVVGVVHSADLQVWISEQRRRNTAEVPLATNVRTRTNRDEEAFEMAKLDEVRQVILRSRKVKLSELVLVLVPEHVQVNGVHSHSLGHLNTVKPVLMGNTTRMHLTGSHHEQLIIKIHLGFFE